MAVLSHHSNNAPQPSTRPDPEPRPHAFTGRLRGTVSRTLRLAVVWLLLTAFVLSLAQPVPYQGVPGGTAWFAGDFVTAYQQAVRVNTAAAQLLASRAATDQAVYLETDPVVAKEWLDRAEAAAFSCLDIAPDGPLAAAATMAAARAKGEAGFYRSYVGRAQMAGEVKALFESALRMDPDNADALVSYSSWHFALTELGVGWLFGANRSQVLPLMEHGIEAAPAQINLRVEYARVLFGLGLNEQGREQAELALSLPAHTAADSYEQARARALLAPP